MCALVQHCIILAQNIPFQASVCIFLSLFLMKSSAHHRHFILEKFHRWWKENTVAQQMYFIIFRFFISCAAFNLASEFQCILKWLFISYLCNDIFVFLWQTLQSMSWECYEALWCFLFESLLVFNFRNVWHLSFFNLIVCFNLIKRL